MTLYLSLRSSRIICMVILIRPHTIYALYVLDMLTCIRYRNTATLAKALCLHLPTPSKLHAGLNWRCPTSVQEKLVKALMT